MSTNLISSLGEFSIYVNEGCKSYFNPVKLWNNNGKKWKAILSVATYITLIVPVIFSFCLVASTLSLYILKNKFSYPYHNNLTNSTINKSSLSILLPEKDVREVTLQPTPLPPLKLSNLLEDNKKTTKSNNTTNSLNSNSSIDIEGDILNNPSSNDAIELTALEKKDLDKNDATDHQLTVMPKLIDSEIPLTIFQPPLLENSSLLKESPHLISSEEAKIEIQEMDPTFIKTGTTFELLNVQEKSKNTAIPNLSPIKENKIDENLLNNEEISIWESAFNMSLKPSENPSETFNEQLPPVTENILAPLFDPLYRLYNTGKSWLFQNKNPDYDVVTFPQSWEMFNSSVVNHYMNFLKTKQEFKFIAEYLLSKTEINLCSLTSILNHLNTEISLPLNQPICIPIVLAGKESLSRNHIVGLMIKDGVIEYFDSMGTPSDQIKLADNSGNLRNVLENLQARLGFKLIENRIKLQNDIHSCGVFVCDFFSRRLEGQLLMGSMLVTLKEEELLAIRERIFSNIAPLMNARIEDNVKRKAEGFLFDEYDNDFDDLFEELPKDDL